MSRRLFRHDGDMGNKKEQDKNPAPKVKKEPKIKVKRNRVLIPD